MGSGRDGDYGWEVENYMHHRASKFAELLLEYNADVNTLDDCGNEINTQKCTPLWRSCQSNNLELSGSNDSIGCINVHLDDMLSIQAIISFSQL